MDGQIRAHVEACDGSAGRKLTSAWWALGTHCCRCPAAAAAAAIGPGSRTQ